LLIVCFFPNISYLYHVHRFYAMPDFLSSSSLTVPFHNIAKLFWALTPRHQIFVTMLLGMQLVCAFLEILSIGAIIPFLSALSNPEAMQNIPYLDQMMIFMKFQTHQDLVVFCAILFGGAIILANIFRFLTLCAQQFVVAAIGVNIGHRLLLHTLDRPYRFYLDNNTSQLISTITNDLNRSIGALTNVFSLTIQILMAVFISVGLLLYHPQIALILGLIVTTTYVSIMFFVTKRLRFISHVASENYRAIIQNLQESFGGIRYIILKNLSAIFSTKFSQMDRQLRYLNAEGHIIQIAPKFLLESMGIVVFVAIIYFHTQTTDSLTSIIPLLGFLAFATYRLLPAIQQIYASLTMITSLSVSLHRVVDVITNAPANRHESFMPPAPLTVQKNITVNNVSFCYQDDAPDWILRDLSFTIQSKTTVAIVGHTGSGKSTLADLLLGLITPQQGQILIDDIPLTSENMSAWQTSIAHVPQSIFLFDASIAENIAFGVDAPHIDLDRVTKVAQIAQIHDFIITLPLGYQEKIGERGVRLSGGQCQRIGIARALYQNPSFIVFDEATSALDSKTEHDLVTAIEMLRHDLTMVVIAHRLSTIRKADNILLMKDGALVATGTYDQLLSNPYFCDLAHHHLTDEQTAPTREVV
jgi:ATP-binding cassette, subfamily B, bacterial PglK